MTQENWPLYNCIDGAVTMKVLNSIKDEVVKTGYEQIYRSTMELYDPLIYMMTRGLKIDLDALAGESERVGNKISDLQAQLNEQCGKPINPLSPKQVAGYFYIDLGLPPYKGKTGGWTTDDKALTRIARKGYPEAKTIQDIRYYNKLKSTYLDVATDEDGRLRCSYNIRGSREGRLSSSQNIFGTGMNLQNLHPKFKSFVVADNNRVFLEIDKKSAEWVVVAYLCRDPNMLKVIEEKLNPHVHTAHLMTDLPKEFIEQEYKVLGKETDADRILLVRQQNWPSVLELCKFLPRSMTCYQAGKKTNHGCNYIMGYVEFALQNDMPEPESKEFVQGYREAYCHLPLWWEQIEDQLIRDRTLVNCFGRRRRFLGEFNHDLLKTAVSFLPQSTVVDLVNQGMIKIYNDQGPNIKDLELMAQVHDSILTQFQTGRWSECATALLRAKDHLNPTLNYHGHDFHIDSELKIGLNWGDYNDEENPAGMIELPFLDNKSALADALNDTYKELTNG